MEFISSGLAALDGDAFGVLDITTMKEYYTQMKETTSNMLERAMRTRDGFERWLPATTDLLESMRLSKAAQRLGRVVAQARAQAHGNEASCMIG